MNITISTTSTLVAAHIGKVSAATGSAYKGIAISFLIEEVKRQMRQGICHFIYRKADGSIREAFGTLDKEVLAKTLNGAGQSPEAWGCYYHDVLAGGARSFRWENLLAVLS